MLENVIKKLFPIRDENNQPCTFPTFASQVFDENGVPAERRLLPSGGTAGQVLSKKTETDYDAEWIGLPEGGGGALYNNLADNSDFTRWVAQAGIGGNHGTQAYGGDRWILTNGTITGEENADGDGYSNITLNGTLVQVVPSPPETATVFVEMVSGTAEISYDASVGEIIITSNGGVIKNVLLLEGKWTEKPDYVARGYAAEQDICSMYYQSCYFSYRGAGSDVGNGNMYFTSFQVRKMRNGVNPTATLSSLQYWGGFNNASIDISNHLSYGSTGVKITINGSGAIAGVATLIADLPRR